MSLEFILDENIVVNCSTFNAFVIDLEFPKKYNYQGFLYSGAVEVCYFEDHVCWLRPLDVKTENCLEGEKIPKKIKEMMKEKKEQGKITYIDQH